jgi:hypothetical protein
MEEMTTSFINWHVAGKKLSDQTAQDGKKE